MQVENTCRSIQWIGDDWNPKKDWKKDHAAANPDFKLMGLFSSLPTMFGTDTVLCIYLLNQLTFSSRLSVFGFALMRAALICGALD